MQKLKRAGKQVGYTPSDVSTAMVLVARETALRLVGEENCKPFVCDLSTANHLRPIFERHAGGAGRVYTFFGMIPNFEPGVILPKLAQLLARRICSCSVPILHPDRIIFAA